MGKKDYEKIRDGASGFLPEIAPKVGYDVAMLTFFNHIYFLLNQRKIIT